MMIKQLRIFSIFFLFSVLYSCTNEEYTISSSDYLVFSKDTIRMDTVFSNIPTSTKDIWVYNKNNKNIKLTSVKLDRGNQSGFRVNIDGIYLGPNIGYQTNEVDIPANDSIRVFVELNAVNNGLNTPQKIEDNLSFILESGIRQNVNLNAYSWDATILNNVTINKDVTLNADKPIVVYGSLKVDSLSTLIINPGTTLYLRDEASINVYGRLFCKGDAQNRVVLRGYRLDNMFDYLPYDRVSGQWGGVHFFESSYGNEIHYTDLHSAFTGIDIDSSSINFRKLLLENSSIHNCQGYGINNHNSNIEINNCQISNSYKDCLYTDGGIVRINNSTIAQFYPFNVDRGQALNFTSASGDLKFYCSNTIITGYADDEINGKQNDTISVFDYEFSDCILRTPKVLTSDSVRFKNVIFESPEDTITSGKKNFINIDIKNLIYDFRLDSLSPAIDKANPITSVPTDHDGLLRDEKPDIGAFERKK